MDLFKIKLLKVLKGNYLKFHMAESRTKTQAKHNTTIENHEINVLIENSVVNDKEHEVNDDDGRRH